MFYVREFKTSDGTTLRYETRGSGPTVVALHGFPDTLRTWDAAATGLADAGFRVVTLAMRGYVPSDVPSVLNYSIARLAQDVSDLLDYLQVRCVTVIGHDWGASAGYALAARFPERVSSLVALAIPPLSLGPRGMKERWARPHKPLTRSWIAFGLVAAPERVSESRKTVPALESELGGPAEPSRVRS